MKKFLILFVVCAASVAVTNAQVRFGVKGGVNLANVSGDVEDNKMKIGFHAGALVQIPVTQQFMVQPEAIFSTQGAKFDDGIDEGKFNLTYVNIPLLARYQSTSGFFAQTGPQAGLLMSAKAKVGDDEEDFKEFMKTLDFSWVFGLGYQTPSGFGVDARFNLGLTNMWDGDDGDKTKNSVIQVGVFYVLGGRAR